MRRAERLDAPRRWLPRGGPRGRLRAAAVGALVVTAAVILLSEHAADVGQHAKPGGRGSAERTSAPAGGHPAGGDPAGADPAEASHAGESRSGDRPGDERTAAANDTTGEERSASDATPTDGDRSAGGNRSADGNGSTDGNRSTGGNGSAGEEGACRPGGAVPPPGAVGFPLRLTDPAVLAVVRAGQRVDVLVRGEANRTTVVASDVAVLCGAGLAAEPDGVLYLAVSSAQARALAAIGPGNPVSVTVRSPG